MVDSKSGQGAWRPHEETPLKERGSWPLPVNQRSEVLRPHRSFVKYSRRDNAVHERPSACSQHSTSAVSEDLSTIGLMRSGVMQP